MSDIAEEPEEYQDCSSDGVKKKKTFVLVFEKSFLKWNYEDITYLTNAKDEWVENNFLVRVSSLFYRSTRAGEVGPKPVDDTLEYV